MKKTEKKEQDLVDRIDLVLSEINKSRIEMCDKIGISRQAITNWKKTNGLPVVDKALKIADFLNVSVEWLINGELSEQAINSNHIALCIEEKLNSLDATTAESKKVFLYQIISPEIFSNWKKGRLTPTFDQVYSISMLFNISLETFLNLKLIPSEDEHKVNEHKYIFKLAQKHSHHLMTYDCMYERDQHYIDMICRRLFKLKRQINGNDFVYPSDPDNPNAQADPNADVQ